MSREDSSLLLLLLVLIELRYGREGVVSQWTRTTLGERIDEPLEVDARTRKRELDDLLESRWELVVRAAREYDAVCSLDLLGDTPTTSLQWYELCTSMMLTRIMLRHSTELRPGYSTR